MFRFVSEMIQGKALVTMECESFQMVPFSMILSDL